MDDQSVLEVVESWPTSDQLRLVQGEWDRLVDRGDEPELTEERKADLDRRIEELDREPDSGIPWEDVKARVLARIRK